MKTQRFTNYSWEKAALGTCFAIMLMALIVLVGWHAHVLAAVQIFRGFILFSILGVACKETEAGTFSLPHSPRQTGSEPQGSDYDLSLA